MQIPLKPRTVGELIGVTIQASIGHFLPVFLIMLIVSTPQLVISWWLLENVQPGREPGGTELVGGLVSMVAGMVLQVLGAAIATVIVASSFTGVTTSLGDAIGIAMKRILPLLGYSLLLGLVIGMGFLLLVIPGVILMVRFYVGSCAIVLDNSTATGAFGRSANLTEGRRWDIFWFFLLTVLIIGVPAAIVSAVTTVGIGGMTGMVAQWVINVIFAVLGAVAPVVMYFDLRVRRESLDIEQLAALVDQIGHGEPEAR